MTPRPLAGLEVEAADPVAAWFLRCLGARVTSGPSSGGSVPTGHEDLPRGTLAYATGLATAAAALTGRGFDVPPLIVPEGMPRSREPLAVPGGFVSADLTDDDRESFERLRALHPDADARALAVLAQEWRLPVVDYRPRAPSSSRVAIADGCGWSEEPSPGGAVRRDPLALDGVVVCDMTSMWAGPLCTFLLAQAGAEVWKVEPSCRPDSPLFAGLNVDKHRVDLDAREPRQRRELLDLIARADLLVDSFSPRVMPNLGLTRAEVGRPALLTMSIPAFPRGWPEREWVAYGTGVHAMLGLGEAAPGVYRQPCVSYPDPLAGLAAFAVVCAMLAGRAGGWRQTSHVEVSLASATAPLLRCAG